MRKIYLVAIIILTTCLISACMVGEDTEQSTAYENNFEIVGDENEQKTDISDAIFKTSDRSNSKAESANSKIPDAHDTIEVPPGRYQITGQRTGNVYVYDQQDNLIIHDIVGSPGVPSLTVDILEGFSIKVDGFSDVFVNPVETKISQELTSGIWEVGLDIKPGTYQVKTEHGVGYLALLNPNEDHQLFELIGGQNAATTPEITLEKNEKIKITGVSKVFFEKVD